MSTKAALFRHVGLILNKFGSPKDVPCQCIQADNSWQKSFLGTIFAIYCYIKCCPPEKWLFMTQGTSPLTNLNLLTLRMLHITYQYIWAISSWDRIIESFQNTYSNLNIENHKFKSSKDQTCNKTQHCLRFSIKKIQIYSFQSN